MRLPTFPEGKAEPRSNHVLLYDGDCGFCHRLVQFILRRDRRGRFAFAALQSPAGQAMLARNGVVIDLDRLDTVYVIQAWETRDELVLARTRAVTRVLAELGGVWALLGAMLGWVPHVFADWAYDRFVHVRYRVFGRIDRCPIPSAEDRARFLGE